MHVSRPSHERRANPNGMFARVFDTIFSGGIQRWRLGLECRAATTASRWGVIGFTK